jgi:hypothetical protein
MHREAIMPIRNKGLLFHRSGHADASMEEIKIADRILVSTGFDSHKLLISIWYLLYVDLCHHTHYGLVRGQHPLRSAYCRCG